jgi:amino acid transporter
MEIASGYIGFSQYLGYVWPDRSPTMSNLVIVGMGLITIFLLYRQISSIGKIAIALWIGTLITTFLVIILGAFNFNPKVAFDFPPNSFHFSLGFLLGLGTAARVGVYDYLGYYDICYIGDEVQNPQRVVPRSIMISLVGVALIYIAMNLSIVGVVPWREFVPATGNEKANFVVSIFMERLVGVGFAKIFTVLVLWTAFGSVFALLLGYSRIPYAAALDGYFFRVFGKLHPVKKFPFVSLLVIGILAIVCSFFSLGTVIDALVTTRILIQFIAQIGAVVLIRKQRPPGELPFRMWLYPLPCIVALAGWIFIFATTPGLLILYGLGGLLLGVIAFIVWSLRTRRWPFNEVVATTA